MPLCSLELLWRPSPQSGGRILLHFFNYPPKKQFNSALAPKWKPPFPWISSWNLPQEISSNLWNRRNMSSWGKKDIPLLKSSSHCYPKRNLSLYLTGGEFFRGTGTGTFGFAGTTGAFFFSGTVTVKESSGGSTCLNLGRKWVERCWGFTRGLHPRFALPLLFKATYHSLPVFSVRWTAEA